MPLRILLVAYADYPGTMAASKHVQRYARGLQLAGDEVVVVGHARDGGQRLAGVDAHGVRFDSFLLPPASKLLGSYLSRIRDFTRGMLLKLDELLARETYDACIYHGRSWIVGRALWDVARRHGIATFPYPVEWHGATLTHVVSGAQLDIALFRARVLPRADGVLAISRFWETWCRDRGVPCVLIPGFADLVPGAAPPTRSPASKPFKIVFVGTWQPRELPETIFEGLKLAIDRGVDLQFVIVGNVGRHRNERDAVRALDGLPELKKRMVFTGWVTDEQLTEHLRTASAFVLLRDESRETRALFPTRLPEYLASANPVILSTAGDLPLYVRHRESAWLIPAGHAPRELADAVVQLASDEEERRRIGLGGWRVASEALSVQHLGWKLHNFIQSVVDDSHAEPGATEQRRR